MITRYCCRGNINCRGRSYVLFSSSSVSQSRPFLEHNLDHLGDCPRGYLPPPEVIRLASLRTTCTHCWCYPDVFCLPASPLRRSLRNCPYPHVIFTATSLLPPEGWRHRWTWEWQRAMPSFCVHGDGGDRASCSKASQAR